MSEGDRFLDIGEIYPALRGGGWRRMARGGISARLEGIDEVSARISDVEPDGKGVPILLRQYLKLNATLLEFNVDPAFGNCLDALVLIDLQRTSDMVLGRYMGKAALAVFRAWAGVQG